MHKIDKNVFVARATMAICQSGIYEDGDGEVHDIGDRVQAAIAATVDVPPDEAVGFAKRPWDKPTEITVVDTDTLTAGKRFTTTTTVPLALNFASGRNPGGGFENGAEAQEESLCRASALYPCLENRAMYPHHRKLRNTEYTSWVIVSPHVPVFRGSGGKLCPPWECTFLTAAAPNLTALFAAKGAKAGPGHTKYKAAFSQRIGRVLTVAAWSGFGRDLVLGAWGCGVFGWDPTVVANMFKDHLEGEFAGVFKRVAFAIPGGKNLVAFQKVFGGKAWYQSRDSIYETLQHDPVLMGLVPPDKILLRCTVDNTFKWVHRCLRGENRNGEPVIGGYFGFGSAYAVLENGSVLCDSGECYPKGYFQAVLDPDLIRAHL